MFNTFIFNVGPASCGKRFLFSFFNQSSLSSLVSISPVAPYLFLTPFYYYYYYLFYKFINLFFISHSLPLSSSLYFAFFKLLPCRRSRLEPPPADLAWSCFLSLSLGGCGSVSNGGWLF